MRKVLKQLTYSAVIGCSIFIGSMTANAVTKSTITGANAKSITLGTSFNPKTNVKAYDSKGKNITKNIKITGTANTNKKGVYYYTYKVNTTTKKTITIKRKITVKAKSYTLKKKTRQFDVKNGYGRHSNLSAGKKISLIEKSTSNWYKTSNGYWVKDGFIGDYIYIGTKKKLYSSSKATSSSKYAKYGIQKVTGSSKTKKRIKTAAGWISSPSFVDDYESKGVTKQQQEIVAIVNKERKANGLKAVVLDSTLSKLAIIRSQDMVDYQYFSHISPNYAEFYQLVQQINYGYWTLGENIAAGGSSAQQYMTMWMNSSGHRANILNANYERIGVGVVKNTKTGFYSSVATQIFAKKY